MRAEGSEHTLSGCIWAHKSYLGKAGFGEGGAVFPICRLLCRTMRTELPCSLFKTNKNSRPFEGDRDMAMKIDPKLL